MIRLSVPAFVATLCIAATTVRAELVKQMVPVTILSAGGFCDSPPDEIIAAPDAERGQYEHNFRPFDFVVRGDRFPAQISLGIGISVRIDGYGPGSNIRVRISPPSGPIGGWDMTIGQTGVLEFGRVPATGKALETGRYYLSVIDKGRVLFTYSITLKGEAEDSLCVPVS